MRLIDSFFGSIALKNRMLSRDQLAEALRIQWERSQGGTGPTLGEICLRLGFLTPDAVRAVLNAQAESELRLEETLCGQIAVKNGLIAERVLKSALDEQHSRGPGARLGHILIERGDLTQQQLHAILVSQRRQKAKVARASLKPTITPASVETRSVTWRAPRAVKRDIDAGRKGEAGGVEPARSEKRAARTRARPKGRAGAVASAPAGPEPKPEAKAAPKTRAKKAEPQDKVSGAKSKKRPAAKTKAKAKAKTKATKKKARPERRARR